MSPRRDRDDTPRPLVRTGHVAAVVFAICLWLCPGATLATEASGGAAAHPDAGAWWHSMFPIAFDGHGNFVTPHLDTLRPTAASLAAGGYHGVWEADLNRDATWMQGHERHFAARPGTKRIVYIEGNRAEKVLARVSADGRLLFTSRLLDDLGDPRRRRFVESLVAPGGSTVWFSDWEFFRSPDLKTSRGAPLPTAKSLGLAAFTAPLDGRVIEQEADYWRTRSATALFGDRSDAFEKHAAIPDDMAAALGLAAVTTRRADGRWLVSAGDLMLYDAQFARYQAAKGRRVMQTLAPDMIHYDDWDLRSPTAMNARADVHVAAFRAFVTRRFSDEDCRECGFEKAAVDGFDVLAALRAPPWRADYAGPGEQPLWRAAADPRWLESKLWRAFQIAAVEEKLAAMQEVYRLNKRSARELGRDVPMVANVIPLLSAIFLQRDCVDMANFEWPVFKTFTAFVQPLGYYPRARLGIGARMAARIGVTGHAIVNPYVEQTSSGWDGAGFTNRRFETLHKVVFFDLVANRGIPAFALAFDGGYSPGSIHSAGNLHAFLHRVAPLVSKRDFLADIGLAGSSWSQIAAQPPWAWNNEVAKRHACEFLGWAQYLASARDFPQWDVVPFDDVAAGDLEHFKLVVLPSLLVLTDDQIAVLEAYLRQGGKLLVTGDTGAFDGPAALLMPRRDDPVASLARRFPGRVTVVTTKPGLAYHENPDLSAPLRDHLAAAGDHRPVLTATNAPEHVGIYANRSRTAPGDVSIDLVNYHHDLASDHLTPVSRTDFTVSLRVPDMRGDAIPAVESIRYDEASPDNTLRQPLSPAAISLGDGMLTLRVPPFTHYQILRITTAPR